MNSPHHHPNPPTVAALASPNALAVTKLPAFRVHAAGYFYSLACGRHPPRLGPQAIRLPVLFGFSAFGIGSLSIQSSRGGVESNRRLTPSGHALKTQPASGIQEGSSRSPTGICFEPEHRFVREGGLLQDRLLLGAEGRQMPGRPGPRDSIPGDAATSPVRGRLPPQKRRRLPHTKSKMRRPVYRVLESWTPWYERARALPQQSAATDCGRPQRIAVSLNSTSTARSCGRRTPQPILPLPQTASRDRRRTISPIRTRPSGHGGLCLRKLSLVEIRRRGLKPLIRCGEGDRVVMRGWRAADTSHRRAA